MIQEVRESESRGRGEGGLRREALAAMVLLLLLLPYIDMVGPERPCGTLPGYHFHLCGYRLRCFLCLFSLYASSYAVTPSFLASVSLRLDDAFLYFRCRCGPF